MKKGKSRRWKEVAGDGEKDGEGGKERVMERFIPISVKDFVQISLLIAMNK